MRISDLLSGGAYGNDLLSSGWGSSGNNSTALPNDLTAAFGGAANSLDQILSGAMPQAGNQLQNILSGQYMSMANNPSAQEFLNTSQQLGQSSLDKNLAAMREKYGQAGMSLSSPILEAEQTAAKDFATQMANLGAQTGLNIYNSGFSALQNAIPQALTTLPQQQLGNMANLYNMQYQAATDPIKWALQAAYGIPVSGATIISDQGTQYTGTGSSGGSGYQGTITGAGGTTGGVSGAGNSGYVGQEGSWINGQWVPGASNPGVMSVGSIPAGSIYGGNSYGGWFNDPWNTQGLMNNANTFTSGSGASAQMANTIAGMSGSYGTPSYWSTGGW